MSAAAQEPTFQPYLERWRVREPEMQFAEPFVPAHLLARFRAWGVVLAELETSLFTPSEVQVASRRLAWWCEELHGTQPQHPAARALRQAGGGQAAAAVAMAAHGLAEAEPAPPDTAATMALLQPLARAVAAAEMELFAAGARDDVLDAGGDGPRLHETAIAAGTLVRWAPQLASLPLLRERLPMHLLARHGGTSGAAVGEGVGAVAADLAAELLAWTSQCAPAPLPLYRALRWCYDAVRLQRTARGRMPALERPVPGPLQATLRAWSAARGAAPVGTAGRPAQGSAR